MNCDDDLDELALCLYEPHKPSSYTQLELITLLCNDFGGLQEKITTIHIAGTAGKGSTTYLIEALLRSTGLLTGSMVSPHVYKLNERIQYCGQPIKDSELKMLYATASADERFAQLTFPSRMLFLGWLWFAKKRPDILVIETGMGGLLDPTNCVLSTDKIAVITKIDYDHQAMLGPSLADIARQKAGIITPGIRCFTTDSNESILKELNANGLPAVITKSPQSDLLIKDAANPQLLALYQRENVALALSTALYASTKLGHKITTKKATHALNRLHLPGRFEVHSKGDQVIVIDGAHNEYELRAFLCDAKKFFNDDFGVILSVGQKKKTNQMLDLCEAEATIVFTASYDSTYLQSKPAAEFEDREHNFATISGALKASVDRPINNWLVTGSMYALSEARSFIDAQ